MKLKYNPKYLDQLDANMKSKVILPALRAAAKVMQQAAIAHAPSESGFTKEHIKVRAGKRKKDRVSVICYIPRDAIGDRKEFYAGFNEFGHRPRPKLGQKLVKATRAIIDAAQKAGQFVLGTHWFQQSFDQTQTQAINTIQSETQKNLETVKKALAQ